VRRLVDTPEAKIENGNARLGADVLQQRVGLFQFFGQRVAIVRVAGKRSRTDHQAVLVRDGQANLDAELIGLALLAVG
jgi:hypothetical protein